MRALLDTNVVVSALLFGGEARRLLRSVCSTPFELWTSRALLRELTDVLGYDKLRSARTRTGKSVTQMVTAYGGECQVVDDASLPSITFDRDPKDIPVIAAAQAARVDWLVTGDRHLLGSDLPIEGEVLTVTEALQRIGAATQQTR
jgi:putative PIN family toxin of toxin-antitoxin system